MIVEDHTTKRMNYGNEQTAHIFIPKDKFGIVRFICLLLFAYNFADQPVAAIRVVVAYSN
jgi:hypothetical protein